MSTEISLKVAAEALDREHLSRMTLGEPDLQREILMLFDRQADLLLRRVCDDASSASVVAHTLKGSARSVGAWAVAQAAETLERADASALPGAVRVLGSAIADARGAIAELLDVRRLNVAAR